MPSVPTDSRRFSHGVSVPLGAESRSGSPPGRSADAPGIPFGLSKAHTGPRYPGTARVRIALGGELMTVEGVQAGPPHGGGPRGTIEQFSPASRRRLLATLSSIDQTQAGRYQSFVTLTYPGEFSQDPKRWKRDLKVFFQSLKRQLGDNYQGATWKLEPQKRGAPHYHLMVFSHAYLCHKWVGRRWFEIVGSQNLDHLAAGISIQQIKCFNGVRSYCSKRYMGKELTASSLPYYWRGVGRLWGVDGQLPTRIQEVDLSAAQFYQLRRRCRNYVKNAQRYNLKPRGRCGFTAYIKEPVAQALLRSVLDPRFQSVYKKNHGTQYRSIHHSCPEQRSTGNRQAGGPVRHLSEPDDSHASTVRPRRSRQEAQESTYQDVAQRR